MKPLADLLWTIVRWTLPLTAAALLVAVAIGTTRLGEEVRRRVEARLQQEFPALEVRVRGANIAEGEGLVIRGIEFADPASGDEESRRIISIDEARLTCGTTVTDLASGDLQISAVRLHRPTLHVVRDANGGWSFTGLLGGRSGRIGVPLMIDDATVVVDDRASRQRLTVRHLHLEVAPSTSDGGAVVFSGGASGDRKSVV